MANQDSAADQANHSPVLRHRIRRCFDSHLADIFHYSQIMMEARHRMKETGRPNGNTSTWGYKRSVKSLYTAMNVIDPSALFPIVLSILCPHHRAVYPKMKILTVILTAALVAIMTAAKGGTTFRFYGGEYLYLMAHIGPASCSLEPFPGRCIDFPGVKLIPQIPHATTSGNPRSIRTPIPPAAWTSPTA